MPKSQTNIHATAVAATQAATLSKLNLQQATSDTSGNSSDDEDAEGEGADSEPTGPSKFTRNDFEARRAITIREFCELYGWSIAKWYRLQALGMTPPKRKMGKRSVLLAEEVIEWESDLKDGCFTEAS